jgi:AmmeMemoRadiSam system protein B
VLGIATQVVVLSQAAYYIAAHFDGSATLEQIHADLVESAGAEGLDPKILVHLADQLDSAGFLHSPTFEEMHQRALADFRASPLRDATCAGGVYPTQPSRLREFLDSFFTNPEGPGDLGTEGSKPPLRGLVSPHIDYRRGGTSYAHAYRALREGAGADLFVVFGTAHASPPHLFTLTRKSYATPLGPVPTDVGVVDAIAKELGDEEVFHDELVHAGEHSVELQMVWLRHLYGERPIQAVPILCSTIDHLEAPVASTERFLSVLKKATAGRQVCFIAGADLAHIGVMYGDPAGPKPAALKGYAKDDRETLRHFCDSDALAFARDARRDGDHRRLCGTSPMFATKLAVGDSKNRLLKYEQWTDGTDSVSFCAVAME